MKIQLIKEASCSPFFLANSTGDILEGDNPLFADLVEAGFAKIVEEEHEEPAPEVPAIEPAKEVAPEDPATKAAAKSKKA